MLPFGFLGPSPGWGAPRQTRLTHDEQRTFLGLWCIFPSPLMVGGDLTAADAWTTELLTNPEVLAVDQHSTGNRPVVAREGTVVWMADQSDAVLAHYLAVFNISSSTESLHFLWKDLGLPPGSYRLRDLWEHKDLGTANSLTVTLPPHGSVLYSLWQLQGAKP